MVKSPSVTWLWKILTKNQPRKVKELYFGKKSHFYVLLGSFIYLLSPKVTNSSQFREQVCVQVSVRQGN